MSQVTLQNVSRAFGSTTAVDGIDLTIQAGEFVTLLGPSGCGKTTTLRMVAGLEQNTGGIISIGGRVVSDAAAKVFVPSERRQLGMVFQSYAIWPHMSVFDNVAYPLRIRRLPATEIEERVTNALRMVEMDAYAQRPAPALSGGQQQRVAIARALVFEPEVLLLDEPLSNLDARLRTLMGDEFRQLQQRLKITTLYVTHDQSEAMALSDRVVVMHRGKILQIDAPEAIYRRPHDRQVAGFFGTPNLLAARVTACRSFDADTFRLSVEGAGWAGDCHAREAMHEGTAVSVMLRPESFELGEPRAGGNGSDNRSDISSGSGQGALRFSGRVEQSIFRGSHRSIVLATGDERLNVEATPLAAVQPGAHITVNAPAESAWAVRG